MRRDSVTIVTVDKQQVLHILSVCLYPYLRSIKAHAPYYIVICSLSGCTIFFQIIS
jgi:hypothetical protein